MRQFRLGHVSTGLGAAVLIAASAAVLAQPPGAPLVTAASATHIALLTGAEEVPPVPTAATGTAWILFDAQTSTVTWTVEFAGLSGPATAAHFHGPAAVGADAWVVLSLVVDAAAGYLSPIQGTATIAAEQAAQFAGGMWYVNVHTTANPGGEIRGQVVPKPAEPAALGPLTFTGAQAGQGRGVFGDNCAGCHGEALAGLDGGPPLVGPAFSRWFQGPVVDLYNFILARMPADRPGSLTPRQVIGLVAFIVQSNGFVAGDVPLPEEVEALARMAFRQ